MLYEIFKPITDLKLQYKNNIDTVNYNNNNIVFYNCIFSMCVFNYLLC